MEDKVNELEQKDKPYFIVVRSTAYYGIVVYDECVKIEILRF
jgi:hypothetical protein